MIHINLLPDEYRKAERTSPKLWYIDVRPFIWSSALREALLSSTMTTR